MSKTKDQIKTMDEYIKSFPEEISNILEDLRRAIREEAPEAVETISYQMPTFKLNGRNLVHFAAWKNHIGFYPTPSATKAFKKELSIYKGAKGSVQFPADQHLPMQLIRKIVRFRVKENSDRKK